MNCLNCNKEISADYPTMCGQECCMDYPNPISFQVNGWCIFGPSSKEDELTIDLDTFPRKFIKYHNNWAWSITVLCPECGISITTDPYEYNDTVHVNCDGCEFKQTAMFFSYEG